MPALKIDYGKAIAQIRERIERDKMVIRATCADAAMDWFMLPPHLRTKEMLREMILYSGGR